jgi:Na+(H+)/acetate symporter ActP
MLMLAGACFASAVLLHGLLRLPLDSVRKFLLVGTPIGVLLMIAVVALGGMAIPAFAAIALYAFLCELYVFCFTLAMSSISATTLVKLRNGPVPVARLTAIYRPSEMVKLRLDRLLQSGFLTMQSGRLVLTERGRRLHATFAKLSGFFDHSAR